MVWYYNGVEFTSKDAQEYIEDGAVGFVYEINDLVEGKKYIGKKNLISKRRLPPLKGKKRRRTVIKESDWATYYGSSESLNEALEKDGPSRFERTILHICYSKGDMSYLELYEQVTRDVLFRDDYYNGIIQVRIHRSHVKGLKDRFLSK